MPQQFTARFKSGSFARRKPYITLLFVSLLLPDFSISRNVQASIYQLPLARSLPQQAQQNPGAQNTQEVSEIEPGEIIERELAGGQSHTYRIRLTEGQYLNAVVEQHGIDVVARLLGPDGKQIGEFDSEIRKKGEETVAQVAEKTGEYRVIVEDRQKDTSVGSSEIVS